MNHFFNQSVRLNCPRQIGIGGQWRVAIQTSSNDHGGDGVAAHQPRRRGGTSPPPRYIASTQRLHVLTLILYCIICQKVFETDFAGRACIVKERVKKSYRLPVLDKKLSHRRLVQEARCILKCRRAGVLTPAIFLVDEDKSRLYLEKMQGGSLKDYLRRAYKLGTTTATDADPIGQPTEADEGVFAAFIVVFVEQTPSMVHWR